MSSQVSGLIHPGFGPANIPLSGPSQARDTDAAQRQRASETGAPGSKVGRLATGPAVVKPEADNGFRWEQQVHEPPSTPKMKSFCCGLF